MTFELTVVVIPLKSWTPTFKGLTVEPASKSTIFEIVSTSTLSVWSFPLLKYNERSLENLTTFVVESYEIK